MLFKSISILLAKPNIVVYSCGMRFKNNSKLKCEQLAELVLECGFVSAASGLVCLDRRFFVVADDENAFFEFLFDDESRLLNGRAHSIWKDQLPEDHAARKKLKPDLESLFQIELGDAKGDSSAISLLALPSGSKQNRVKGALVELSENTQLQGVDQSQPGRLISACEIDVSPLYQVLREEFADLNIEGAVVSANKVLLMQRGNSLSRVNAIIELDREVVVDELLKFRKISSRSLRKTTKIQLPIINGELLTFTDACMAGDRAYFLAAAEKTDSTYDDGEFSSAILGTLNQDLTAVESWSELDVEFKPEGLCCERKNGKLDFYFVTDADDSTQPSKLFRVRL